MTNADFYRLALQHMIETFYGEPRSKKERKLKVHKLDDRMMEDGTLNVNHPTLKEPYMSDSEFNARQRASKYN